jgi:hypothetical protein
MQIKMALKSYLTPIRMAILMKTNKGQGVTLNTVSANVN